jgi:beta-phosphoglucomutase-like phosphatase (HAD superfamily)
MQALIFDLDGTLVDTVYAHTFAWQKTPLEFELQSAGECRHLSRSGYRNANALRFCNARRYSGLSSGPVAAPRNTYRHPTVQQIRRGERGLRRV